MAKINEFLLTEYGKLVRFVRRNIDDAADRDAEDIVQDVMLNLFDRADITAPIENLSAYIYRALRNRVTDLFRNKREKAALSEMLKSPDDVAASFERSQLQKQVFTAIGNLPDKQRAVIIATEFENRSFKEIAREWQVPIGTLLARKSRALQKIKKELAGSLGIKTGG
ncbi:MAG: sigma-70 family RNA polymerase sigma factor [Candidatus Aminicenantes bacterium]|nr:sigma-70 family RNA polymerase sigma factor [Candidatus Aminicenantes bacterium]